MNDTFGIYFCSFLVVECGFPINNLLIRISSPFEEYVLLKSLMIKVDCKINRQSATMFYKQLIDLLAKIDLKLKRDISVSQWSSEIRATLCEH